MTTKAQEETRFTLLSPDSINLFAETIGVVGLPNSLSKSLAEDATFRIRHVIQTASQYMKHAKRRRLTTDDLNRALQICSIEPIYGYGSSEEMPFRNTTVKETEIFFVEEKDVSVRELALGTVVPTDPGKTTVKAQWLCIEGIPQPANQGTSQGKQSVNSENAPQQKTLSEACHRYYEHITKAILGDNEKCRKVSLEDLRTNPKISTLLAYFINFISVGVKTYSHDLKQLSHILAMVRSIVDNSSLFLEPYVIQLVTAVMYCLLESLAISLNPANDHWRLRDDAARILAHISRKCSNTVNYLRHQLLMTLQEVLVDDGRPYCSHYGAVVGLAELGPEGLEHFLLPYIKNYWKLLQQVLHDNSPSNAVLQGEAYQVYGALLQASSCLLKSKAKGVPVNSYNFQVNNSSHPMLRANLSPWAGASMMERRPSISQRSRSTSTNSNQSNSPYQRLYSLFGDSLVPMIAFNNWQDSNVTKNNLLRIQPLTHAYFPLRPLRRDSTVIRELIMSARANLQSRSNYEDVTESILHPGRKRQRHDDETTRHPEAKREKKSKWSSLSLSSQTKLSTTIPDIFEPTPRGRASVGHVSRKKGGKFLKRKHEKVLERSTDVSSSKTHVVTGRIKRRFRTTRPVITNGHQYDYHLGVTL
ncbi:TAF6-like RNA polymerase II p300/CBP-associated factor-associated factor 65 kDa subunit 6L [Exaiptasia diaphana]|uniref:TATA box binding protein associated factor (TAF) histone-like fold domain-containing protein n=1 Tax=Exaiptasia diaphana TaxID=2652724 RepID=A0A913X031_EXADI|nr:TAF6-like RNA polymerase II p300/CBP-associated factor-associated factor 65 kDa subunit 6L [Exaiptasia diaphana]KXJ29986.1 TAF6-like RNA polymerase II p300/CBP-associated factor-associated factor 65 kDa subunit 6L [Exaiptasia diaphana]